MSNVHPKLNWSQFQIDRAKKRKKKLIIWWFFGSASLVAGVIWFNLFTEGTSEIPDSTSVEDHMKVPKIEMGVPAVLSNNSNTANTNTEIGNALKYSDQSKYSDRVFRNKAVHYPLLLKAKEMTKLYIQKTDFELRRDSEVLSNQSFEVEELTTQAIRRSSISTAYLPWHSARFITDEFSKYRPLNSLNVELTVPLSNQDLVNFDFIPSFRQQRFQLQYYDEYEDQKFLPGSIVGYTRNVDSILPVFGDTVFGTTSRTLRKNGTLQELVLPIHLSTQVYNNERVHADAFIQSGMMIRLSASGLWSEEGEVYVVDNTSRIGVQFSSGFNVAYSLDYITVSLGYAFVYQSHALTNMRNIYHQPYVRLTRYF